MDSFPSIDGLTKFPCMENTQFEFKSSVKSATKDQKYLKTLCAFLNRDGGFLVVGVYDDRKIVGIPSNECDRFLSQFIDCIVGGSLIITSDNQRIHPDCIKASCIPVTNDNFVLVVKATPLPDVTYKLNTGEVYIRVNASNQSFGEIRYYTQSDVNTIIHNMNMKLAQEMLALKKTYAKTTHDLVTSFKSEQTQLMFERMQLVREREELLREREQFSRERDQITRMLFDKILNEKKRAETTESNWFAW